MDDVATEAWTEQYSGRERVRMVVETLAEPASIAAIAQEADVAWGTANSEIETLVAENKAQSHTVDGQTQYGPNPVQVLIEEVLDLIHEHDRDTLESRLIDHTTHVETIQSEYDVATIAELRDTLVADEVAAEDMRAIRNAVSTWETHETEIRLLKHALELYEDVTQLSDADGDERVALA